MHMLSFMNGEQLESAKTHAAGRSLESSLWCTCKIAGLLAKRICRRQLLRLFADLVAQAERKRESSVYGARSDARCRDPGLTG
jgi:hypothetical protein